MSIERVDCLDDSRLAAYRNLRDRTLRGEEIFVTEGRVLTLRLLESSYTAESVLVTERYAEEFARAAAGRVPVYVASQALLMEVVGFNFHRGVLGSGRRRTPPTLDELLAATTPEDPVSLIILPEVTKPENLGLVFRSAGAFALSGVVLGQRCCDSFSRRALRLSMGAVLYVPFARSADLLEDLRRLKERRGVELVAAVLDPRAEPLEGFRWPRRVGLLLGHESDGLRPQQIALCDRRVTIPMAAGIDSLNLGVAGGIFAYEMSRGG